MKKTKDKIDWKHAATVCLITIVIVVLNVALLYLVTK
jgi:hypothetical protein